MMLKIDTIHESVKQDNWLSLKQYTIARIALGRAGVSIPLQESLHFKMSHAHARDAVYASLDKASLRNALEQEGNHVLELHSMATSRQEYLQRPDLGRTLAEVSRRKLVSGNHQSSNNDVAFILADGLSALAINKHAVPVITRVIAAMKLLRLTMGPVLLVEQGRVAIGDEIGFLLRTRLAIVLIGERPGLSSPDSMGAYLTYNPRLGLSDNERNCISNIRPEGLPYEDASRKIVWLINESLTKKISGVTLKENMGRFEVGMSL